MPIPPEVFQTLIENGQDVMEGSDGGVWILMLLIFGGAALGASITLAAILEHIDRMLRKN